MVDVTNGGGYGRFYSIEENKKTATNAVDSVKNTFSNDGVVTGVTNSTENLEKLKKSIIQNGIANGSAITNQIPGVQSASQAANKSLVNLDLKSIESFQNRVTADIKPPLPNILSYYSSYNYVFTLSVLTPDQLNFPDQTYKKGIYGPLILRSAGGAPDSELVPTAYGKYDFYIDNVNMKGTMGFDRATGNTNNYDINFTIIEPYSMGLFWESLQTAAAVAGYRNYLDVPLCLTIEFKGHIMDNETQLLNQQIDNSKKDFVVKLRNLEMKVTGKGSTYTVEAYPYNYQGFSTQFNQVKEDVNIKCNDGGPFTVQALLQTGDNSLQKQINDYFQRQVEKKQVEVANQILILFPSDISSSSGNASKSNDERIDKKATANPTSANGNDAVYKKLGVSAGTGKNTTLVQATGDATVNKIGQASLGFNPLNKGDTPFLPDDAVYDEKTGIYKRGNLTINYNNSDFRFNQGSSVVDMINQVILISDYGRNALNESQRTNEGQIWWWRIETELYTLAAEDAITGVQPKLVVFRVVPYKVDCHYILPVNAKRPKLENLQKQALKEYNYIYTGKNTDILDFQIDFKVGFTKYLAADGNKNSPERDLAPATGAAANNQSLDDQKRAVISQGVKGFDPTTQLSPTSVRPEKISTTTADQGGAGYDKASTAAARQFQDLLTTGYDMINVSLKILGDPYYIADSGIGNYTAKGVAKFDNITADGSINYQNGQPVVQVNFRTPIDINMDTGYYNFGGTRPIKQFSGLYTVQAVTTEFIKGKFTQTLDLVRITGQDNPNAPEPTKTSTLSNENVTDSIAKTNSSILAAITKNNNNNQNAPNPSLPGVINTGGFTI